MSAVRAQKAQGGSYRITRRKGLSTDFTLILSIAAIIVIDEIVWCTAQWAYGIFWDGFSVPALNWLQGLMIFPLIVFNKELPILFDECFDDRKFIDFEFLIFGRMGIIECSLFERDISADKI